MFAASKLKKGGIKRGDVFCAEEKKLKSVYIPVTSIKVMRVVDIER